MKTAKIFYAMCAMCAFSFVSCSDDDDDDSSFKLPPESVSFNQGDNQQMAADDGRALTWSVDDEFVATIDDDGLLTGCHVGETNIVAVDSKGGKACAKVVVEPKYNLYTEPCIQWGDTKEQVKGLDKRELLDEDDNTILLKADGSADYVLYTFEDGGLKAVSILIGTSYTKASVNFLFERYEYLGYADDIYVFTDRKGLSVLVQVYSAKYIMILYCKDPSSKSMNVNNAEAFDAVLSQDVLALLPE